MSELREKIAGLLSEKLGGDHYTTFPEDAADAILAIPEIRDALQLREEREREADERYREIDRLCPPDPSGGTALG